MREIWNSLLVLENGRNVDLDTQVIISHTRSNVCVSERVGVRTSGKVPFEKTISKHVFPQAPSPTMTNLRLISDIALDYL